MTRFLSIPLIQRKNLCNVVLLLKTMCINNLVNFDYMDSPSHYMLLRALKYLYSLGALNNDGELTKLRRRMAEFQLDYMLSKMIRLSLFLPYYLLEIQSFRTQKKQVHDDKSFIKQKAMKRAQDIKEQLTSLSERIEIDVKDESMSIYKDISFNISKCITSGFNYNSAKKQKSGTNRTLKNSHEIEIHPSSLLYQEKPERVINSELVLTTKECICNQTRMTL